MVLVGFGLTGPVAAQMDRDGPGLDSADVWHTASAWRERGPTAAPSAASIVAAAHAELMMGRHARARAILDENPVPDSTLGGAAARIYAIALYRDGEHRAAGDLFVRAGLAASGLRAGVLLAQGAEAYEAAGDLQNQERYYSMAAEELPSIAGWLALREARATSDTAEALSLLRLVPSEGWLLAGAARADILLAAGDTLGAIFALAKIERYGGAAQLAWASGDLARGRDLAYRALRSRDSSQARPAGDLALEHYAPQTLDEYSSLARVLSRYRRASDAVELMQHAVATVDSSAPTLMLLARLHAAAGNRWGAVEVYHRAAGLGEDESPEAEYQRARQLMSLKQTSRAQKVLRAFVAEYPAHARTPVALYLVGDLDQDAGRRRTADSIYKVVAEAWPDVSIASQARLRLAAHAIVRGDTTEAVTYFRAEAQHDGAEARASRYQLARLLLATGDSASALREWVALAQDDSVGYYGTMARRAAEMAPPNFVSPDGYSSSPDARDALGRLDLLEAIGLDPEADALIGALVDTARWNVDQLLEIGEGLNSRGHTIEGIRLGWRLTSELTLNHPRVVRMIFPFPYRNLVEREAGKFDLDPFLVAGLIRQESAFDPHALSRAGARGLMQLMPSTARGLARRFGIEWDNSLLVVPDANVHVGTAHLAALVRQYEGQLVPSLAAYNAGGRAVARWLRFPEAKDAFLFVERIPYRETRGYVRTLLRNRELYAALYGDGLPVQ